jgi:hypothetical protein
VVQWRQDGGVPDRATADGEQRTRPSANLVQVQLRTCHHPSQPRVKSERAELPPICVVENDHPPDLQAGQLGGHRLARGGPVDDRLHGRDSCVDALLPWRTEFWVARADHITTEEVRKGIEYSPTIGGAEIQVLVPGQGEDRPR